MKIDEVLNQHFKDYELIKPLQGGMMNKSYLFSSGNKKYVLYMPTKQSNEMVDRNLEKVSQAIVIDLNITSKNFLFDTNSGIKINEFIEGDSLNHIENINTDKIATLLHTLHNGKLTLANYNPFARLLEIIKEREMFVKEKEKSEEEILSLIYANQAYLEEEKIVLSHNDFQRSNIVLDPNDNYFVIDFEFMANNYETYDIACFGNDAIKDGEQLLKSYKGENITSEDFKRFYLWRMFVSLQWRNVAIIKHHRDEGKAHNVDFLYVANHFLKNAQLSYEKYKAL